VVVEALHEGDGYGVVEGPEVAEDAGGAGAGEDFGEAEDAAAGEDVVVGGPAGGEGDVAEVPEVETGEVAEAEQLGLAAVAGDEEEARGVGSVGAEEAVAGEVGEIRAAQGLDHGAAVGLGVGELVDRPAAGLESLLKLGDLAGDSGQWGQRRIGGASGEADQ
jgi:hypothetical protein